MKLLFIDTETTGLPKDWKSPITDSKNWPRCVELAFIGIEIKGTMHARLADSCLVYHEGLQIPAEATAVHGITDEMCREQGKKPAVIFEHLHRVIAEADFICGHNISFDMKIVNAEFHRLDLLPFFEERAKQTLCTMQKGRGYSKGGKWPKLEELFMALFGKPFEGAHRAWSDIAATERCFYEMVKRKDIIIPGIDAIDWLEVSP